MTVSQGRSKVIVLPGIQIVGVIPDHFFHIYRGHHAARFVVHVQIGHPVAVEGRHIEFLRRLVFQGAVYAPPVIGQATQMRAASVNAARQQTGDAGCGPVGAHVHLNKPFCEGHVHVFQLFIAGDALQMARGRGPRAAVHPARREDAARMLHLVFFRKL